MHCALTVRHGLSYITSNGGATGPKRSPRNSRSFALKYRELTQSADTDSPHAATPEAKHDRLTPPNLPQLKRQRSSTVRDVNSLNSAGSSTAPSHSIRLKNTMQEFSDRLDDDERASPRSRDRVRWLAHTLGDNGSRNPRIERHEQSCARELRDDVAGMASGVATGSYEDQAAIRAVPVGTLNDRRETVKDRHSAVKKALRPPFSP